MASIIIHIKTRYGVVEVESSKPRDEAHIDILDYMEAIDEPEVQKWVKEQMAVEGIDERLTTSRSTNWIL